MAALDFSQDEIVKFKREPWQQIDIDQFLTQDESANWSDMGTYKTSTALWFIDDMFRDQDAANVLIVTTKSGKGPYFECMPSCLNLGDWKIFNVGTKKVEEVVLHDLRIASDWDALIPML